MNFMFDNMDKQISIEGGWFIFKQVAFKVKKYFWNNCLQDGIFIARKVYWRHQEIKRNYSFKLRVAKN